MISVGILGTEAPYSLEEFEYKGFYRSPMSKHIVRQKNLELYPLDISLKTIKRMKYVVKSSEILHVYFVSHLSSVYMCILSKLNQKPLIVTTGDSLMGRAFWKEGIKGLYHKLMTRISWNVADKIISYSYKEKRWLKSLKISEERIEIIPPGVNYPYCKALYEKHKSKRLSKNHIEILSVASIYPFKNLDFLITTFEELIHQTDIDLRLTLIGCIYYKSYYNYIKDLIQKKNLDNQIELIINQPYEKMFTYYARADIFVLISIIDQFPKAVQEAMTCELPVIVSEKAGTSEICKRHNCGFVVNPQNQMEIQIAILDLAKNKKTREKLGKNGANAIRSYYTWDIMIPRLKELYERTLRLKGNKSKKARSVLNIRGD